MQYVGTREPHTQVLGPRVRRVVKKTRPFAVEIPPKRADADARSRASAGACNPLRRPANKRLRVCQLTEPQLIPARGRLLRRPVGLRPEKARVPGGARVGRKVSAV